jgi:ElaB/YqjD/DUF883 family membrane-anchored ribosome-binding protein
MPGHAHAKRVTSLLAARLQRVVEQLAQLSEQEQDDLAARIEADLEEDRRWAAAMDDPRDLVLDQSLAAAKQAEYYRALDRRHAHKASLHGSKAFLAYILLSIFA